MPMMIALKAATPQLPRTTAVADHVVAVDETDSTNALAVQMIGDGSLTLPDHQDGELAVAVVAADRQTAGRGRNGHKWVSQPGRCSTMSYAVRIPRAIATDESVNGWLQMIAGLVTLDALNGMIEEYGAAPNQPDCSLELKWPNDVFCHGLKLGGLLSELVIPPSSGTGTDADADADDDVVIVFGVGLNLALGACRLPTPQSTSLQLHVSGLPSFGEMRDAVAERQVEGFRERLVKFIGAPLTAAVIPGIISSSQPGYSGRRSYIKDAIPYTPESPLHTIDAIHPFFASSKQRRQRSSSFVIGVAIVFLF